MTHSVGSLLVDDTLTRIVSQTCVCSSFRHSMTICHWQSVCWISRFATAGRRRCFASGNVTRKWGGRTLCESSALDLMQESGTSVSASSSIRIRHSIIGKAYYCNKFRSACRKQHRCSRHDSDNAVTCLWVISTSCRPDKVEYKHVSMRKLSERLKIVIYSRRQSEKQREQKLSTTEWWTLRDYAETSKPLETALATHRPTKTPQSMWMPRSQTNDTGLHGMPTLSSRLSVVSI